MEDSCIKSKQTKSIRKNASDEQENRPKKETIIKPDPSNSISISNQLRKKKSSSNSRRLKRKSSSAFRNPPNAKPMPSLADLEKMFEESDDDIVLQQSTEAKQQPALKRSAQTSSSSPLVVIETTSPPRKKKKSLEQSDDLPPLNISSENKSVTAENISYQSTLVSEVFCPIPSTSQSTEAFIKNENIHLESSTVKQKISETHYGTIVIEDEPTENTSPDVKIEVYDPQIFNTTIGFTPTTLINKKNSYDDDDCIIVEDTTNNTTNQPNIIDIVQINTLSEYDSNSTENVHHITENVCDEVIDVDAIIAHNQSLIGKHKTKSAPLNHVVDVDISTPTLSTNIQSQRTTNDHQPELKASHEKITISLNVQSQPNNDLVHRHSLETTQPATSRTFPTSLSYENCLHLLTQNGAPAATTFQYVGTTAIIKPRNNRRRKQQNNRDTHSFMKGSSTDADAGKHHSSLGCCPICMENMTGKEIGTTTCGHLFCMRCLKLSMKHTKRCPTCRKVLKKNGFHKIFI